MAYLTLNGSQKRPTMKKNILNSKSAYWTSEIAVQNL